MNYLNLFSIAEGEFEALLLNITSDTASMRGLAQNYGPGAIAFRVTPSHFPEGNPESKRRPTQKPISKIHLKQNSPSSPFQFNAFLLDTDGIWCRRGKAVSFNP